MEKENRAPTSSARRNISVSSLFSKRHRPAKKQTGHRSILAPITAGIYKTHEPSKSHLLSKTGQRRAEHNELSEAANGYRQGMAFRKSQLLQPIYDELISRVEDLHHHSDGEDLGGLCRPLQDSTTEVELKQDDGTVVTSEVKLGDVMEKFQQLLNRKRTELEGLLKELYHVDNEIFTAIQRVLAVNDGEAKQSRDDFDTMLAELVQQADEAKSATLEAVKDAIEEDQTIETVVKQKFQELTKALAG